MDTTKENQRIIKSNEIRIGNWILGTPTEYKSQVKPFKVYAETFSDIESSYGIFKPIPLTEEILLKCGFEKGLENNYHLGVVRVWHEKQYNKWYFFFDISFKLELSGLHDLQNAYYYTHDKTELTVTL